MKTAFTRRLSLAAAALAITLTTFAVTARADLITPISATASSNWISGRIPERTIDSSGLTGNQHVAGSGNGTMWMSDDEVTPWIYWDLGAEYVISGFHLWQYNEVSNTDRGVKTTTISVSTNNIGYTSLGSFGFLEAPGVDTYTGDDYTFSSDQTTRYIRFDVTENWGDPVYTGLAEIRFDMVPVPEPGPIGVVITGIAIFAGRRRRARA